MKKKQEETKRKNVIGAILSGLTMLAVLWGTFYLNQILAACNNNTIDLLFDGAQCSTRWTFMPLWITGIALFLFFGAMFGMYTQDL